MTQNALAEKTGISRRMVSYYERDSETIPANQLKKIAQSLRVRVDELINYQPEAGDLEANRAFLKRLETAKNLPAKDQKVISDIIDSLAEKAGLTSQKNGNH